MPIYGIKEAQRLSNDISVFHGATKIRDDILHTDGGRILSVVGTGNTLEEARILTYSACELIEFHGKHYRTDIGACTSLYT